MRAAGEFEAQLDPRRGATHVTHMTVKRWIAGGALAIAALAPAAVQAQSKAHQDARDYGLLLGRAVWCDIAKTDWQKLHRLAGDALDSAAYNDPERSAVRLKMKDMIDQTARARPAMPCDQVERDFAATLVRLERIAGSEM